MSPWQGRLAFVGLLVSITALLGACAMTEPPSAQDLEKVNAGDKTILLFRVAVTLDGEPHEPFSGSLADDNVGVALGTFETGGRVRQSELVRFLSDDSRAQGWAYVVTEPGTLYMAFLPPRRTNVLRYASMFKGATRWRVDAPPDADVVYAGTVAITGAPGWSFFGNYLKTIDAIEIRDERAAAEKIVKRFLPNLDAFAIAPMQRHFGPVILTTPDPE